MADLGANINKKDIFKLRCLCEEVNSTYTIASTDDTQFHVLITCEEQYISYIVYTIESWNSKKYNKKPVTKTQKIVAGIILVSIFLGLSYLMSFAFN
jgi:hypothetical protein